MLLSVEVAKRGEKERETEKDEDLVPFEVLVASADSTGEADNGGTCVDSCEPCSRFA